MPYSNIRLIQLPPPSYVSSVKIFLEALAMERCTTRTLTFSAQGREILPYRCRESRSRGEEAPIPKATYTRCKHSSTPHVHTLQTSKHSTPIPNTTLLNSSGRHEEKQKVAITETKKRCTPGVNTRAPRHCGGFLSRGL